MGAPGEEPASDPQGSIAVVVVVGGLPHPKVSDLRGPRRIEFEVEGILRGPLVHTVENFEPVVPRVAPHLGTEVSFVCREARDQEDRPILQIVIPVVVRTHSYREKGLPLARGNGSGESLDR